MPWTEEQGMMWTGRMEKSMLRVGEAAELLSVSRWTIYRWVENGRLRGTKLDQGSLRIFRESVTGLIKHNETTMSRVLTGGEAAIVCSQLQRRQTFLLQPEQA
jgi:excisionase family DNA binding protein